MLDPETLVELLGVEMVSPVAIEEVSVEAPLIDVCEVGEIDGLPGCSDVPLRIALLVNMVMDDMIVDWTLVVR